ncbi:hypothetical protein GY45DRAFT_1333807 [Cubamyces sp. BRFM 1775]|nr:hypothetical protein GY45DRAFT_1333807 [Cubamyces sp. BRFM 1775]
MSGLDTYELSSDSDPATPVNRERNPTPVTPTPAPRAARPTQLGNPVQSATGTMVATAATDPRPRKRARAYSSPLEQAAGVGLSAPRIPIKPLPNLLPEETADELTQLPENSTAGLGASLRDVDMRDDADGRGAPQSTTTATQAVQQWPYPPNPWPPHIQQTYGYVHGIPQMSHTISAQAWPAQHMTQPQAHPSYPSTHFTNYLGNPTYQTLPHQGHMYPHRVTAQAQWPNFPQVVNPMPAQNLQQSTTYYPQPMMTVHPPPYTQEAPPHVAALPPITPSTTATERVAQLAAAGVHVTAAPVNGFPKREMAEPADYLATVDADARRAWQAARTAEKVVLHIAGSAARRSTRELAVELEEAITLVTGNLNLVIHAPSKTGPTYDDTEELEPWLLTGLREDERRVLLEQGAWSMYNITFFVEADEERIPAFVMRLEGFVHNYNGTVEKGIRTALKSKPLIDKTIAAMRDGVEPEDRLAERAAALVDTLRIEVPGDEESGDPVAATVYADTPPTASVVKWLSWKRALRMHVYKLPWNTEARAAANERCRECHGVDHTEWDCPFIRVVGWHTTTLFPEDRWRPAQTALEVRSPGTPSARPPNVTRATRKVHFARAQQEDPEPKREPATLPREPRSVRENRQRVSGPLEERERGNALQRALPGRGTGGYDDDDNQGGHRTRPPFLREEPRDSGKRVQAGSGRSLYDSRHAAATGAPRQGDTRGRADEYEGLDTRKTRGTYLAPSHHTTRSTRDRTPAYAPAHPQRQTHPYGSRSEGSSTGPGTREYSGRRDDEHEQESDDEDKPRDTYHHATHSRRWH